MLTNTASQNPHAAAKDREKGGAPARVFLVRAAIGCFRSLPSGNIALTSICGIRYRKDFGSCVVARLMVLASSSGESKSGFLSQPFSIWESSDVNVFPQRGGNCAQVVRRGCERADARAPGFTGGAPPHGQRESAVYAVYRHWRSRHRDQRGKDPDERRESRAEGLSALHR